jgi:hypothetical protein
MASILTSLPRDASIGAAGLKYCLVCVFNDVSTDINSTTGLATCSSNASSNFVKFTPRKLTSNYTETGTGNPQTGTMNYNQVLTLVFAYNQVTKRNQLKIMGVNELKAIAVDRNGDAWLFGNENGLDLTGSVVTSGTGVNDLHGLTITLTGNEREPYGYVSPSELARVMPS